MRCDSDREEEIFNDALEISDPDARDAYLRSACSADTDLRERVEALLTAAECQNLLFSGADSEPNTARLGESVGKVIDRYKLLEQIGEGGFGVVYMAEQEEPVRRKVALKIIKLGMDTRQVIARFEAERQALAMMEHPGIAKVLDAGTTESGRPYFVMELVRGVPITEFCLEHRYDTTQRLSLFLEVCDAVQHAHQKGIIHRDLKPSNVIVTLHGRKAVPKVIDFGIAKAIQQPLTDKTIFTRFQSFIGTPEYTSPEQAEMSGLDIDTRSDIYTLGVLLYEILTGSTPLPRKKLLGGSLDEMRRMIREEQPERPSTRNTRSSARGQSSELEAPHIPGDLDRIVMKAIDKDRENRYESVDALGEDIQRFLQHEPVRATEPTAFYRFRKFARRNRTMVGAGILAASAMILGLCIAVLGLVRANTEARRAQQEAANAESVLTFLNQGLMGQIDPFITGGEGATPRSLTLLSAVRTAAEGIKNRFQEQPQVEAALRLTLGRAYRRLAETEAAQENLGRAVLLYARERGATDPKTLEAKQEMAWLMIQQVRLPEAEELSRLILEIQQGTLGSEHEKTLEAMTCLGHACRRQAKNLEAQKLFQEVLWRAEDSPELDPLTVLSAMEGLAWTHYELGEIAQKVSVDRATYEKASRVLGPDHPIALGVLVPVLNDLRRRSLAFAEAEALAKEGHRRCLQVLGEEHPTTIAMLNEISGLEAERGLNYIPLQRDVLARSERALGRADLRTTSVRMRLGLALVGEGYPQEGIGLLKPAMETIHQTEGLDTLDGRRVMRWLARSYVGQGRYSEAEQLRTRTADACRRLYGMTNAWTQTQFYALGNLYARQGKWSDAANRFRAYLDYPPANPSLTRVRFAVGTPGIHVAALLAHELARDSTGATEIAALMVERYGVPDDPSVAFEMSKALLLVPTTSSDVSTVGKLTDVALSGLQDSAPEALLSGLSAYRGGSWEQAVDALSHLLPNRDAKLAAVAGFFTAMAHHRNEAGSLAAKAFAEANQRLEGALRSGDLGNTMEPGTEWTPFAAAIVARNQAETLISGKEALPRIDSDYLARNRVAWKPVKDWIEQAGWAARRRDWAEARKLFQQATQQDRFDWTAATHQEPGLEEGIACVLVLDGQSDRYSQFCQRHFTTLESRELEGSRAVLLAADPALTQLQQRALELARRQRDDDVRAEVAESTRAWRELTLGMAEYRNGDFEQALAALEFAQGAFNLNCSGTAHAFAALAESAMGRRETAEQHLQAAESAFQRVVDGGQGDAGRGWSATAMFEIALKEARSVVR